MSSSINQLEQKIWECCVKQRPAKDRETAVRWQTDELSHLKERFVITPLPSNINELVQAALLEWHNIQNKVLLNCRMDDEQFLVLFEKIRDDYLKNGNEWLSTVNSIYSKLYGAVRNLDWVNLFCWILPKADKEHAEKLTKIGKIVTAIYYIEMLANCGHDHESGILKKIEARWCLVSNSVQMYSDSAAKTKKKGGSMSFLEEYIKGIVSKARENNDISVYVHEFKEEIENTLATLHDTNDLRVYDGSSGGVLRGPVDSRKKYEVDHDGKILVCCDYDGYIEKNKYEVPYTRAIFNSGHLGVYRLISYESPLMRKATKNINPGISGRKISCDLIGINNNDICCIEVKVNPFNDSCRPSYALLEGFAYCICLNWILKNCYIDLEKDIKLCCDSYQVSTSEYTPVKQVKFSIAAPIDEYFFPYWKIDGKSEEWFRRRRVEIEAIERVIISDYGKMFSGYIGLSTNTRDIMKIEVDSARGCVAPMINNLNPVVPQPFAKIFQHFYSAI